MDGSATLEAINNMTVYITYLTVWCGEDEDYPDLMD
jgi:hypothetical protein